MSRSAVLRAVAAGLVVTGVAGMLAACAGPGVNSPEAKTTVSKDDAFQPYEEISGAEMRLSAGPLSPHAQTVRLIARRDRKTRVLTTHAHVKLIYQMTATLHFEVARNDRAEALPMKLIARDGTGCRRAEGCRHVEEFVVDLPEAELRKSQQSGYKFKLFARRGQSALFPVPPELVRALFQAADGVPAAQAQKKP